MSASLGVNSRDASRYIDDYTLSAPGSETGQELLAELRDTASRFELELNSDKSAVVSTSERHPRAGSWPSAAAAYHKRALAKAILQLPADLRDVFLLHRMAGLSFKDIGQQLGIERTVVQANLAEALARIVRAAPLDDV